MEKKVFCMENKVLWKKKLCFAVWKIAIMVKNVRGPSVRERGYAGNNTQNFSEFPHLIISIKVEKQKSCSREKELWYWLFANVYFANIHIKTAQTNYRKWEIWCLKVILRNKRFFKALFVFLKNVSYIWCQNLIFFSIFLILNKSWSHPCSRGRFFFYFRNSNTVFFRVLGYKLLKTLFS